MKQGLPTALQSEVEAGFVLARFCPQPRASPDLQARRNVKLHEHRISSCRHLDCPPSKPAHAGRLLIKMQDPSQGVVQTLVGPPYPTSFATLTMLQQNHIHLISSHRFPLIASLSIEQALSYLVDAPQIVKQVAPMAWTYVQAPQDGTVWLEWLSPSRVDNRFPSDGYVWADPEQTYRQEFGGYTVEILQHTLGYRLNLDSMATHARTRYHFLAKNPSLPAAPPDPQLWLVHYHQTTDPNRIMPTNQLLPSAQMQQVLRERAWLEAQGRLEKKEFMLHDRDHWPSIGVPSGGQMNRQMQQPGLYGAQSMGGGMQMRQPPYPQGARSGSYGEQPPAKRPRQDMRAGSISEAYDTSIEDEENTTLGDYLDHLTPRDISMARYMQHHRWMEEVFSSPYASNQIVPTDLGLGLMGELKGLTDGILPPPSLESPLDRSDPTVRKPKEAQPFTNLAKEQIEEFNKRVEQHLEEGRAEIERMKAEHAAKMQEWKKTKTLLQAEQKLRYATWEGHENATPVYRLDVPASNGHDERSEPTESVNNIVDSVQSLLKVKIVEHKEAELVERGGLEEEPGHSADETSQRQTERSSVPAESQQLAMPSRADTASTPQFSAALLQSSVSASVDQAQQQTPAQHQPQQYHTNAADPMQDVGVHDDTMMGDIDLDLDATDMQFDESQLGHVEDDGMQNQPLDPSTASADAAQSTTITDTSARAGTAPQDYATQASQQVGTREPGAGPGDGSVGEGGIADEADMGADSEMFHDSTFDDFTNMGDGDGDDGLIDFDGGVGMNDSAFGDALHGMDTPGDQEGLEGDAERQEGS